MAALSAPPQIAPPLTTRALMARNAALPLLSFVASGLTNMAAQRFFAGQAGHAPEWALSATLLVGTLGSLAGVALAQRAPRKARGTAAGGAGVVLVAGLTVALFHVAQVALYAVLHTLVRLLCNTVTHLLDERAVLWSGAGGRSANDRVGTGLRFVGMLVGPLWLGLVDPASVWTALCLAALGAAALGANALLPDDAGDATGQGGHAAVPVPTPLPRADRFVAASGVAIYAAYYLLASSALGLVVRQHPLENAPRVAGLMITAVYGSAIVATVLMGVRRVVPPLRWMGVAPVVMALCAAALAGGVALPVPALMGGAASLGVVFAAFMLAFRNHATRRAREGVEGFVAVFNNLGNVSALVGFGAMHALVVGRLAWGGGADVWLGAGLVVLALMGVGLLWAGVAAHTRTHVPPGTRARPADTSAGR